MFWSDNLIVCVCLPSVIGLAAYYYTWYGKLTTPPTHEGKSTSNNEEKDTTDYTNRTIIRVGGYIETSNVEFKRPPAISFQDMLDNRLQHFAPDFVGVALGRFVEDAGYSNTRDGTKAHRGEFYIPWTSTETYTSVPTLTVKNLVAIVLFYRHHLNQSFPVDLVVQDDLELLRLALNMTMPIQARVRCNIVLNYGVGTLRTPGEFMFHALTNSSAEFALSNMTINRAETLTNRTTSSGKHRVRFKTNYRAWTFAASYSPDVHIRVDPESVKMTSFEMGTLGCRNYGIDLCVAVENAVVSLLFGNGPNSFNDILSAEVETSVHKTLGRGMLW